MPFGMEVVLSPWDFMSNGDPAHPFPKRRRSPTIFARCLLWPNGWMDQDGTWYGGRPQLRRLCVRWGPSPLPQKGRSIQFSARVYCGQTAGCIKMALGMQVALTPGDCVRWGLSPFPKKGAEPHPIFGPCLLWPIGCMDQDATWYRGRPRPQPIRYCVRCGPSYPQKKGHIHRHPIFGPFLLWPNGWMDEEAAWYGSRPRPRLHCTIRGPSSREAASYFRPMSIVATVAHLS